MSTVNKYLLLFCVVLLLVLPFAFIARTRAKPLSTTPRIQIIQDLDKQPHYKAQRANPFFADDRAMRPHIPHTIAREDMILQDPAYYQTHPNHPAYRRIVLNSGRKWDAVMLGQVKKDGKAAWLTTLPVALTRQVMARGHQRFVIYCSPCHGRDAYGNGTVNRYVSQLRAEGNANAGTWVPPANLHDPKVVKLPDGEIYNVITNGFAAMAGYKDQVPTADRWAIVAYVRALQLSEEPVNIHQAPPQVRAALEHGR